MLVPFYCLDYLIVIIGIFPNGVASTKPECVTKEETDQIYWDDGDAQVTPYNTPFGTPAKNSPLQPTERDVSKKCLDFEDIN